MTKIQEKLIQTSSGLQFQIREAGQGPLLMCLHGISANGAVWDPVVTALSAHYRTVAVDQRGHGRSSKPATGYTARDFAGDIVEITRALDETSVVVVGHSLGARNGVVAASTAPETVRAVVAIDFTPYIEKEVLDNLAQRVKGGDRDFHSQDEIRAYLSGRYPLMPPDAVERRTIFGYVHQDGVYRARASSQGLAQTADGLYEELETAFTDVKRPVLLVRGAVSKLVSEQAFAKTRALRPDMPHLVVDGADHYVPEEAPDVIVRATHDFLQAALA